MRRLSPRSESKEDKRRRRQQHQKNNHFPFSCYDFYFYSDDFIQAQPQIARWASEDVVSVVLDPDSTQSISIIKTPQSAAVVSSSQLAAAAPSASLVAVAAQSAVGINDSAHQIQQQVKLKISKLPQKEYE